MSTAVHSIIKRGTRISSIEGDFPLDDAVIKALLEHTPEGTKVVSANSYGSSAWTITARINVTLPTSEDKRFFLKIATEDAGKAMLEGEFNGMSAIYEAAPNFAPKPLTWGSYQISDTPTYFFLCAFIDMSNKLPEPVQFCEKLANLHKNSVSPTGKFGFHLPTCHGRFKQNTTWDESWTSFFANLLQAALDIDKERSNPWPEFDAIAERTVTHVVPRLLGALEADGRKVKPSLIHGDLWEGNVGTDFNTGEIYIFDAGAYYAHYEMEIGMWRCARHKIRSKTYKRQYLRNMGISEPVAEFEDRNRLYCVKMNIIHSAHHPGSLVRETAYNDMLYLVDKYAPYPPGEAPPRTIVAGEENSGNI